MLDEIIVRIVYLSILTILFLFKNIIIYYYYENLNYDILGPKYHSNKNKGGMNYVWIFKRYC